MTWLCWLLRDLLDRHTRQPHTAPRARCIPAGSDSASSVQMTPLKIRRLLSAQKNAEVLRIYLAPEGIEALKARRKGARDKERKGDRGKRYTEGWVEFGDKRVAKRVAQKLHGTPMGGTRRSAHYEALWNLRYLSRFKWHHLTEEDRAARAESAQAFAAEVREAARERNFYASRVNQARAIEKRKRAEEREDGGPGSQVRCCARPARVAIRLAMLTAHSFLTCLSAGR